MSVLDLIFVVFLGIVLIGGIGSLFYYMNKKEEDKWQ